MRIAASPLLILLVALLAAASIQAQTPSTSPAVEISGKADSGTVSVDQVTFEFTVKNNSPLVPGIEQQSKADVAVTIDGIPAGWTVSAEPSSFELAPGASQAVKIKVQVAPDADSKEAALTVIAVLVSPLEGLDPILGQNPQTAQTATDSAPLRIEVRNSLTRNVMETLGPWIYVVLLLLVAAVLVAVILTVSARRALVRLASDTRELSVVPGGKVAFPFRIEGLARDTDTVLLAVSAVQEGWAAFLPVPELVLEPGQAQELSLVIIAPHDAAQGTRQAVLVTATSAKAPKGAANLEFIALVEGVADVPTAPRRAK
ncbi:MAG: NEW3 domain-containing protein [Candidatus Thermoplasmatota archaeon]